MGCAIFAKEVFLIWDSGLYLVKLDDGILLGGRLGSISLSAIACCVEYGVFVGLTEREGFCREALSVFTSLPTVVQLPNSSELRLSTPEPR